MVITYHNDTCFKVTSGSLSTVIDPSTEKFKADLTLISHAPLDAGVRHEGAITGGGEYEMRGGGVRGVHCGYDAKTTEARTFYRVLQEGIALLFLGTVAEPPASELLEKVGEVDILFIPVGKGYLEPKQAEKLAKLIDASIVMPYPQKQVSAFLDAMGQKCETVDKLTLKKKDIVEMGEKTKIVCLKS